MHFKYLLITRSHLNVCAYNIVFFSSVLLSIDRFAYSFILLTHFIHHLIQLRSIDFCANYLLLPHLRHLKHFAFCFTFLLCALFSKLMIIVVVVIIIGVYLLICCSVLCFCAFIQPPHNKAQTN